MKKRLLSEKNGIKLFEVYPQEDEWDKLLDDYESGFFQTYFWGKFSEQKGDKSFFFILEKDNKKFPILAIYEKHKFYNELHIRDGGGVFLVDKELFELFFDYIKRFKTIKIQLSNLTNFDNEIVKSYFNGFGFSAKLWATYLIDLSVSEDELFKNLKHSLRKNIRKAIKQNIEVEQLDYIDYFQFYKHSENENGRDVIAEFEIDNVKLMKEFDNKKRYHFFVAKDEDGYLAGKGGYRFNIHFTEIASTMTKRSMIEKKPSQDFISWNIIKHAKDIGCKYYNLAGINPYPTDKKEENIKRFKEKWGGEYKEYYILEYNSFFMKLFKQIKDKLLPYYFKFIALYKKIKK